MFIEQYNDVALRCIQIVIFVALPLLLATLVVGLLLAVIMAATQVQEQNILTTVKIFIVTIYFGLGWPMISAAAIEVTSELFAFARYGF